MIKVFPRQAIGLIRCPCDGGEIFLTSTSEDNGTGIVSGVVTCLTDSSHSYKIVDGILKLMLELESLDDKIQSEIQARDRQAANYDIKLSSRFDKELPSTLGAIGSVLGKSVIEYGCGTGRITKHLLGAELIVAIDFSYESLVILAHKLSGQSNLALIQSEITSVKIKPKSFDLAVSIQVIEHIPTSEMRAIFFNSVKDTLVDNGLFILSAYHFDLRRRLKNKPRIGQHNSGIYYHYFGQREIRKEMERFFDFYFAKKIDITWPMEARLHLNKLLGGPLSRLGEKIPGINNLGHLILIKAKRKPDFVHYQWGLVGKQFLTKHWFWFTEPKDIPGVAMVNFFSYKDVDCDGFYKKPGLTSIVDLRHSEGEIFGSFRTNFIQKQIQRGERNQIVVKHSQDFKSFRKLYQRFRKVYDLPKERIEPLQKIGEVFLAYYQNQLIAGGLFITNGSVMRAWALASLLDRSNILSREIIGQANRVILWEAMRYAKSIGCSEFDLGGISPKSPDNHLRTLA